MLLTVWAADVNQKATVDGAGKEATALHAAAAATPLRRRWLGGRERAAVLEDKTARPPRGREGACI